VTSRRGRGRRDNGLDAALWSPVRDVDPRVGEHLLDVLSAVGIAAYLQPSADVGPYTRTVFLPSPPSDRLFVDRARRSEARTLIEQQVGQDADPRGHRPAAGSGPAAARTSGRAPEGDRGRLRPDLDEDAEWARIVAAFEAERAGTAPDPMDDDPAAAASTPVAPRPVPLPLPPPPHEPAVLDRPEEHYVPPPPPPVQAPAPASLYATLLIAGGLLLVGAPGLLRLSTDTGLFLGVAAIAAGVAMLLSRMRDRSEDDGDDGAVV
jgi:hypothetical protein